MSRPYRTLLIVFAILFLLLVIIPLAIPILPPEGTVPPERLTDSDSRFIRLNGINVHYKLAGDHEPALVLLHGFASSTYTWHAVMPALAEHARVLAYDRPAFGLSSRPLPGEWTGPSPYSPQAQVDLLFAFMDTQRIRQAVLVGNSAGGTVATLAALQKPERVSALVLVDPALSGSGGGMFPDWIKPFLATPQVRRIGPLFVRNARDWGTELAKRAWHDPSKITPEIWEEYLKPLRASNWDVGLYEFNLASASLNLESRLSNLRMPTLVITGDDDRVVPTERSIRAAEMIPNGRLVVIPNCGHAPQEECPSQFLYAVNEFLNSSPLTRN